MTTYTPALRPVHDAADAAFDRNIEELRALCRIPSRRWQPEAMQEASEFLVQSLRAHGAEARSIPWADSHPYVLGRIEAAEGAPVLLHYNHYDVEIEPAGDDRDLEHPPFAAEIHDGKLYARGVADDKAALLSRVHAARAFADAGLPLPTTVVFLHEGKESLHSPGLASFAAAHADELRSDATLWENSWFDDSGRLLLKLSEKGLVYVRLTVRRLRRDGSSQNSSVLPHAALRLAHCLASLQDAQGRVPLPGFADDVRGVDDETLGLIDEAEFDAERLGEMMGLDPTAFGDDAPRSLRLKPTLTITGIESGSPVDSVTLRLPAAASATLEFRLVPGQSSEAVLDALRAHLAAQGFDDVEIEVMGTTEPHATDHRDPFVELVAAAGERAFGIRPAIEPLTPLVGNQAALAGPPIVGIGVGRAWGASDPNQHVRLEDYRHAVHHVIEIMGALGSTGSSIDASGSTV
ncbi:M20/M25/M40 family metallo-hydrolase [Microbacterium sp. 179-I 3D3 NHS]|uniref:M20/M25/M40 family metallo-hydrolase n=1 Tax=Microbacterium sp. 179-I 3D3 NHS TaxID=3142382 RepID=UPI0039A0B868